MDDPSPPLMAEVIERAEDTDWLYAAEDAANTRLDAVAGELLRCIYLQGETESEIILVAHPAIVDEQSIATLFHELLTFCIQDDRSEYPFFHKMPIPSEEMFPLSQTAFTARSLPFLARTVMNKMQHQQVNTNRKTHSDDLSSHCILITLDIPAGDFQPLIRECQTRKVNIESILQAAMMLSVHHYLYGGKSLPLQALTFSNMRPSLEPSPTEDTIACYISVLSSFFGINPNTNLWELTGRIQTTLEKAEKRGEVFIAARLGGRFPGIGTGIHALHTGTTALTCDSMIELHASYGDIQITGLHRFLTANPMCPVWMMRAGVLNDALTLDAGIQEHHINRMAGAAILATMRDILLEW